MSPTIVEPRPGVDLGRVVVSVVVQNLDDFERAEAGSIERNAVRQTTVYALVDSGPTFLCLPGPIIKQLGLKSYRMRPTRSVTGVMDFKVYRGAWLTVEGRSCPVEVLELPGDGQALLGQIPLETLDFWIDVTNRRLVGNPEHGGEWMAEVY